MRKPRVVDASDQIRARVNGAHAKDKIEFMRRYLTRGLNVAGSKVTRVYVDLFAGPGRNVDTDVHPPFEFPAGAIEAVQLRGDDSRGAPFTQAYLVNLDPKDHEALTARVDALNAQQRLTIPRPHISLVPGDANVELPNILREIHPQAFVFVYADPENIRQFPFSTVQALRQTMNHQSVDLYVLLPLEMDINRKLTYEQRLSATTAADMTAFFGTDEWRPIYEQYRRTPALGAALRAALEDLYLRQLRTLWEYADSVLQVKLEGNRVLYRMLMATSDEAALRVFQGVVAQREKLSEQPTLFDR